MPLTSAASLASVLGLIATLVLLEGLLSADNALVLAVMVRHLPPKLQKRALRYGIIGAFVFRLIAVLFSASLLDYWIFKVVGGCYLLYLSASNLVNLGEDEEAARIREAKARGRGFWGTVIAVELADVAFSIDSIVAAVALADGLPDELSETRIGFFSMKLWIVYIGGILGIVLMRLVAGFFIRLLDRFAGLAAGAYVLVGWIGLKLLGSGFDNALHPHGAAPPGGWRDSLPAWAKSLRLEMHDALFWIVMALIVLASMLYRPRRRTSTAPMVSDKESKEV